MEPIFEEVMMVSSVLLLMKSMKFGCDFLRHRFVFVLVLETVDDARENQMTDDDEDDFLQGKSIKISWINLIQYQSSLVQHY